MGLFNFGKKKVEETKAENCCCCNEVSSKAETEGCGCGNVSSKAETEGCGCGNVSSKAETKGCSCGNADARIQSIKVLGAGCKSCHEMYENTKKAVKSAGIDVEVEYVTDMEKVMTYGIMSMPGLVINEKVASFGKVLKSAEVEKLLKKIEQ